MSEDVMNPADPRIRRAVSELEGLIRERFPSATVVVSRGEDPDGIYLDAIVDLDDPDPVMDVVVERLLELQVDEGIPVHVLPLRTPEREVKLVAARLDKPLHPRWGQAALGR
ncbi:MAG TPA: hypothetical protein VMU89_24595 [Thermomicrobiaceae bacterium]|nr:hypothetical protein [Thermomicrobiaceae bacterium]